MNLGRTGDDSGRLEDGAGSLRGALAAAGRADRREPSSAEGLTFRAPGERKMSLRFSSREAIREAVGERAGTVDVLALFVWRVVASSVMEGEESSQHWSFAVVLTWELAPAL